MIPSRVILFLCLTVVSLSACRDFPEVEVSEKKFDAKTPYPEFVPVEVLLEEPEPEIDAEFEAEMTTRTVDLDATPEAASSEDTQDPLLDRLAALRKKRDAKAAEDQIISEDLRKRMESGIQKPTVPE